jgi:hypothetical protein
MSKEFKTRKMSFYFSLILVLIGGCQGPSPKETTPIAPTKGSENVPPEIAVNQLVIASDLNITDFGWRSDGQIYYAVGGNPGEDSAQPVTDIDESAWYLYSKDHRTSRTTRAYPKLSTNTVQSLEKTNVNDILYMTISPRMDKVIYTQLPEDYIRPKPLPHDYVDPAEIWVAENMKGIQLEGVQEGRIQYPLLNKEGDLYKCGRSLSIESAWFFDETLVLGSCYFEYGIIRVYFLADLQTRSIQFLDFTNEAGDYIPTEQIAVAHNSPSLAFWVEGALWMVSVGEDTREIPLKLSEFNFLFDDRPSTALVWSMDDQWLYYWTFNKPTKYDENGFVEYQPWWLEKINVTTREREVVLSEADLLSLLGYEFYHSHTPLGFGIPWKLSADEKSILLYLGETVDNTSTLFLISWK